MYWEGTDSKVKARHPVECREEEVMEEGWWRRGGGATQTHNVNSEAHAIVPCAISAVSCCDLCMSYTATRAAFLGIYGLY